MSLDCKSPKTYREMCGVSRITQEDLTELTEISITKRAARKEGDTFSKRDVPLFNVKEKGKRK